MEPGPSRKRSNSNSSSTPVKIPRFNTHVDNTGDEGENEQMDIDLHNSQKETIEVM